MNTVHWTIKEGVMNKNSTSRHRQLGRSRPLPSQTGSSRGDALLPAHVQDRRALREGLGRHSQQEAAGHRPHFSE